MNDPTILKSDLLDLASKEALRMRAFGETVIFGHHKPFDGNCELATAVLSQMLDDGIVGVYRDEDGLFVGPTNPDLIDTAQEAPNGL